MKKMYEEESIRAIAEAIREQNGTQDSYTVAQMGNAVRAIRTQPNLEVLNVTENGNYLPSAGKDGFSSVSVTVESGEAVIQPLSVTQNGTYNPPSGVDGFAPVTVNVSGWSGSLPSGYTQTLFTEGDGTAYINSGISPAPDLVFHLLYAQYVDSVDTRQEFGSRYDAGNTQCYFSSSLSTISTDFAAIYASNTRYLIKDHFNRYNFNDVIINRNGKYVVNGYEYPNTISVPSSEYPIYIFALNQQNSVVGTNSKSKFFFFEISNQNGLVAKFIPCVRDSDSKAGFYDVVRNQFYGNVASSGSLIAGPTIL